LRPYYASLWPDPNCTACGALEPTAAYRYTCSTCADADASTSDGTSTRNTNTSARHLFIHSCNHSLEPTVEARCQGPPSLEKGTLVSLFFFFDFFVLFFVFLFFSYYFSFISSHFKGSVLIICSPFLFGRVLRPYYASLWPDPNCTACGALEPTAAYRYTCSTCADADASTSNGTSTSNTFIYNIHILQIMQHNTYI
jgi:hypothetical protein